MIFFCWIDASANGCSDMRHNAKRVRPKKQYIVKKSQQETDDSSSAIYDAIAGTCSQQGLQGMHKVLYVVVSVAETWKERKKDIRTCRLADCAELVRPFPCCCLRLTSDISDLPSMLDLPPPARN